MNNMEHFRKVTKIKLILMCLATLLPIVIVSSLEAFIKKQFGYEFLVLRYLAFALFELAIILKIVNYCLIITNENYCLKIYTKIRDERNIFIRSKIQNITIKTILFLNAIGLICAGFLDPLIFIVLAIETGIIIILYFSAFFYYRKKY